MSGIYAQPAAASYNFFLNSKEVSSHNLSAFNKWNSALIRYKKQQSSAYKACEEECPAKEWDALLEDMEGKPVKEQMDAVNHFFNQVPYKEDRDNWESKDYWATPHEMLVRGGDCEDYAIAKYISLKRLGIDESSMRIIIVEDNNLGGIVHAVLEVKFEEERYILDNQASSVIEEKLIYHYRPIYAINARQWWAYR